MHLETLLNLTGRYDLSVIGTADGQYAPAHLRQVQEARTGQSTATDSADHGLEFEGNVMASLRTIEHSARAIDRFLV
jgi:hypothetical protein